MYHFFLPSKRPNYIPREQSFKITRSSWFEKIYIYCDIFITKIDRWYLERVWHEFLLHFHIHFSTVKYVTLQITEKLLVHLILFTRHCGIWSFDNEGIKIGTVSGIKTPLWTLSRLWIFNCKRCHQQFEQRDTAPTRLIFSWLGPKLSNIIHVWRHR